MPPPGSWGVWSWCLERCGNPTSGRLNLWVLVATWTQLRGILSDSISSERTSWDSLPASGKGHNNSDGTKVSSGFLNTYSFPKKQQKQKALPSPWGKLLSGCNQVENMVSKNDTSQLAMSLLPTLPAWHGSPQNFGARILGSPSLAWGAPLWAPMGASHDSSHHCRSPINKPKTSLRFQGLRWELLFLWTPFMGT